MAATHVALLHSIVLSPGRRVVMADLRAMAAGTGLNDPRTLGASGNLVFEAGDAPVPALERALESGFAATFGRHVDIIVRTAACWRALAAANPFAAEADAAPAQVHVRVMRDSLPADIARRLEPYLSRGERVAATGGHLWVHFAGEPGQSRLASQLTPKRMGIGTTRNWNTVRGVADMLA